MAKRKMLEPRYEAQPAPSEGDLFGLGDSFGEPTLPVDGDLEIGAAYQRISTPGQEDGTSLEKQSEINLANAARMKVHIPEEYNITEIASGADPGRPGFLKMSRLVSSRLIKNVFVHDADRLARDPWHLLTFVRLCKENNVRIHFADGEVGRSIIDEAIQYFKGVFGYMERDKIAERTMDGKRKTALNGRMPNGCGHGLFGYDMDPSTGKRVVNEAQAAVYLEAVDRAIGGESCSSIAKDFRHRGIRTKGGNSFDARTLLHLLRNEAPTGQHWWGTQRWELLPSTDGGPDSSEPKRPKRRVTPTPPEAWIRLTDFTPGIIDRPQWELLQETLAQRSRRGKLWDYILSDFFRCGDCGSPINGATQQRKGVIYPYYRCSGTLGDEFRPKICRLPSFRGRELERAVWEHIVAVVRDPSGILNDLRKAATGRGRRTSERRIADLQSKVKKCRREEATLVMQRTRGLIDQEMLESLIAPIANLRHKHEKEIAILSEQQVLEEGFDEFEKLTRAMFERYSQRLDSIGDEDQQRLMQTGACDGSFGPVIIHHWTYIGISTGV